MTTSSTTMTLDSAASARPTDSSLGSTGRHTVDPAYATNPLAAAVEAAGLTGRGGAAFTTATKLRAAASTGAELIVNGCDGELGAAKDAYVLTEHLDTVARAAAAVTGSRVLYAVHRDSATHRTLLAQGVAVLPVPERYVSSEESALVSLAHGGLARPMTKWLPFIYGGADSTGRRIPPTLVLNAETVWRIGQLLERGITGVTGAGDSPGVQWFRSQGTPAEPGPRLVTVGWFASDRGAVLPVTGPVFEIAAGRPLADLLRAVGATPESTAAVLVGGLGGTWLTAEQAWTSAWSDADLARWGARTGPGVVTVLHRDTCPVCALASLLRYAGGESAGQCGPCMFGMPALADDVVALAGRGLHPAQARGLLASIERRLPLLIGRGACRFPDGVSGLVASSLRVFGAELADHDGTHGRARAWSHASSAPPTGRADDSAATGPAGAPR